MPSNLAELGATLEEDNPEFTLYENSGGRLTQDSYNAVVAARDQTPIARFMTPTLAQVKNMGDRNDLRIYEADCVVYGILRTEIDEIPGVEQEDATLINALSDQALFAEMLLIQNRIEDHAKFVGSYPNIFAKPRE